MHEKNTNDVEVSASNSSPEKRIDENHLEKLSNPFFNYNYIFKKDRWPVEKKKKALIAFRVSEDLHALVKDLANTVGVSANEYIKNLIWAHVSILNIKNINSVSED